MASRLHFERIDSSGTFRSGDVRLDVHFRDEAGNKYTWYPKWEDLQSLYAEAERVEEMNPTGDEDLQKLKELKQLDDAVVDAIGEIVADTWYGDDLAAFFERAGFSVEYGYESEEHANTFPVETGGADKVRENVVQTKLRELNEDDYEKVVEVVEQAVAEKEHIDKDERRETIRYRLNEAVKHEGWTVTHNGNVQPIQYEE